MHGQAKTKTQAGGEQATERPSAYTANSTAGSTTTVAVVGAGFLGKCIALDLSLLGVHVLVCDTNPQTEDAVRNFTYNRFQAKSSVLTALNQLSSFAYELLHPLLYLGYVTKSMVTQACGNISVVSDVAQCADAALVIEAVR
jgi:3-hydroxyacyl-CoA dehydrogenase